MQIDVVDVAGLERGTCECSLHRTACAEPLRVRRRHMVGIARFTDAEQQYGIGVRLFGHALEQHERGCLADGDAVARHVEGPAGLRRRQLQGMKAIKSGEA